MDIDWIIYVVLLIYFMYKNFSKENIIKTQNNVIKIKENELRIKNTEMGMYAEKVEVLTKTIKDLPFCSIFLLEYETLRDNQKSTYLSTRSLHPAPKAAEVVKRETQRRREAEYQCRQTQCLLEYYRSLFPSIEEDIEESFDPIEFAPEKEDEDIASRYLSKDEYCQLSSVERNQRALDRFWERSKSKRLIGKLYEQYVGYTYEQQGYQVEYFGITEGVSDLGRDLVCSKEKTVLLIQCDNGVRLEPINQLHKIIYRYLRSPLGTVLGTVFLLLLAQK